MFIDPGERLILMDYGGDKRRPSNLFTYDELVLLAGIGIRTIYYQGAFMWDDMQPTESSPINWSGMDRYIDDIEAAGLRCLLPCYHSSPLWKPRDWYLMYLGDSYPSCPAYYNPQAARDIDALITAATERYRSSPAQFIYSMVSDGEFAFPGPAKRSEPEFPVEIFIDWVVERQRLFNRMYNEVWTSYHMTDNPSWADTLYRRLRSVFPESRHYAIQFTYDGSGKIQQISHDYGVKYFVGAEYVAGLRRTVPLALSNGFGLLCAPLTDRTGGGRLTPHHLHELEWAVEELHRVH